MSVLEVLAIVIGVLCIIAAVEVRRRARERERYLRGMGWVVERPSTWFRCTELRRQTRTERLIDKHMNGLRSIGNDWRDHDGS